MKPLIGALLAALACGTGCRTVARSNASEMARLADPPTFVAEPVDRWLSAAPGATWNLVAVDGPKGRIDIRCIGFVDVRDRHGLRFRLDRDGKPWREEVLATTPEGLMLIEMGKAGGPGMRLEPPMRLASAVPRPGEEFAWSGAIRIGRERIAARGYAVTRDPEPVAAAGARGDSLVLDALVELLPEGAEPIPFPVSRWYALDHGPSRLRLGVAGRLTTYECRGRTAGGGR